MRSLSLIAVISFVQCAQKAGLDPRRYEPEDWAIVQFNMYLGILILWMVAWIILKLWRGEDLIDGPRDPESELRSELRRARRWRERDRR
jgi:hypothetical protein